MGREDILLPEGIEQVNFSYFNAWKDANEILGYCSSCRDCPDCEMNQTLRNAMGDNFPYWSDRFVSVEFENLNNFFYGERTVFCADYQSNQLGLPGISRQFSDGVERLMRVVEERREKVN